MQAEDLKDINKIAEMVRKNVPFFTPATEGHFLFDMPYVQELLGGTIYNFKDRCLSGFRRKNLDAIDPTDHLNVKVRKGEFYFVTPPASLVLYRCCYLVSESKYEDCVIFCFLSPDMEMIWAYVYIPKSLYEKLSNKKISYQEIASTTSALKKNFEQQYGSNGLECLYIRNMEYWA